MGLIASDVPIHTEQNSKRKETRRNCFLAGVTWYPRDESLWSFSVSRETGGWITHVLVRTQTHPLAMVKKSWKLCFCC